MTITAETLTITVEYDDLKNALAATTPIRLFDVCLVAQAIKRNTGVSALVGQPTFRFFPLDLNNPYFYIMDEIGQNLIRAYDMKKVDDLLFPVTFTATRATIK